MHDVVCGFDTSGECYECGWLDYFVEVVDLLLCEFGVLVCVFDVGVGIGKLMRLLFARGLMVIVVEFVVVMREMLVRTVLGVDIYDACVDALLLLDGLVDVVVVG